MSQTMLRKFKCPLVPVIPLLSILFCGCLIFQLKYTTREYFTISLVIGLAVYFVYGIKNSKLRAKNDDKNNEGQYYERNGYKFIKRDIDGIYYEINSYKFPKKDSK